VVGGALVIVMGGNQVLDPAGCRQDVLPAIAPTDDQHTLQTAFKVAGDGEALKSWTIAFLRSHGDNLALADIIEARSCSCELVLMPLSELAQTNGPEGTTGVMWTEKKEIWHERIFNLVKAIGKGGLSCPPLIITNFWGGQSYGGGFGLGDGCHRLAALAALGYKSYPTIVVRRRGSRRRD
jgi:hypothetical protein